LVGNFKNNGREWRRTGRPELVNIHDFIDPKLSRAAPYGVVQSRAPPSLEPRQITFAFGSFATRAAQRRGALRARAHMEEAA
jgi:Rhodopirellula transposase DDE domain